MARRHFILPRIRFLHLVVNLLLHGVVFVFLLFLFLVLIRAMDNKSVTLSEIIAPKDEKCVKNAVETNFRSHLLRLTNNSINLYFICF